MSNSGLFWYCLLEVWIWGSILPQKHYSLWTISKPPRNQLKLHMQFIWGEITSYVKFGLVMILFAWGFNSRLNSAAETLLFMNHKQTTLDQIEISYSVYWGLDHNILFGLILISASGGFNWGFNSAANWSYKGFGYLDIKEQPINLFLLFF